MRKLILHYLFIFLGILYGYSQANELNIKSDELKKYSISDGLNEPNIVYSLEVSIYNDNYIKENSSNEEKLKSHYSLISKFKNLRKLTVFGDFVDIEKLTPFLEQNKKIEEIHILRSENIDWDKLFVFFSDFQNLKYLKLSQINDLDITESICDIKNLRELRLVDVIVSSLSDELSKLNELETFSIQNTNLIVLPESLADLPKLKKVIIIDQPRFNFEKSFEILSKINSLKYLSLFSNELHTLPDEIGQLRSLEELYLSNNNLKTLPMSLIELKKLKLLACSLGNPLLKELPEEFLNSFHLRRLNNGNFTNHGNGTD